MILGLIVYPMLALLAALGLIACSRTEPRLPGLLTAVRTAALLAIAVVYIAALWGHA
ncbi:hypothetical protein [Streptomyces cyaneofuscatus]|uniref:hypothetical protein n=1 Tax=Streptomyces cyaneofuscatus TaxID=66883 RepID=UPI0013DA9417|nr:hypothetical protein [Streptomyces cyaneofuscatus]NDZ63583.1 hypothetical protein [Streptomyces cyaneofuscatus]